MVTEAIRHGLPCDVEALEETVEANVEAQQRDNESANEARQAFPGFLTERVVEKPLASLRSMQEKKLRVVEHVRWRSLDDAKRDPLIQGIMLHVRSDAF